MTWQILLHALVLTEDLPALDRGVQKTILKTVRKKLGTDPEAYGLPLRGEFAGYWKLRVGDYRVIYTIKRTQVIVKVIKIGARKDYAVYEELIHRLPKVLDL